MHPKQSEMIKDFQYQFDKKMKMLGLSYTHL
ncbi:ribonuclease III, partial [Staphylococcus epidermidis]|nr:ribonuclease III [Staphylococcus epidermidis]